MTIDEALVKIRETQRCLVVWNSETGEILSVSKMNPHPEGKELFSRLESMGDHRVPTKARYFDSSKVTRQVLETEHAETERIKTRVRVLTQWAAAATEDLLRILESGTYSYPMARDHDSLIIVDHLWKVHREELTQDAQGRLRSLVGSAVLSDRATRNLEAYLLALCGDEQALVGIWADLGHAVTLMDCFSYTNTQNQAVIGDLIGIVEKASFLFHPRYKAMMTLGRLDDARKTRAAEAIRASVHDSTPQIVAARNCVLARLNSDPTDWARCPRCCYGQVHSPNGRGESDCPNCFGLGLLRKN